MLDTIVNTLKTLPTEVRPKNVWLSSFLKNKYDVLHIILEFTSSASMSSCARYAPNLHVGFACELAAPVEVRRYLIEESIITLPEDTVLFGMPAGTSRNFGGDDYFKGYWSIISAALAEVCKQERLYDRSRCYLASEIEREGHGTSAETYHMLADMMDELSEDVFIEWFRHDSETPQFFRRSTPFIWIAKSEYKYILEEVLRDIVENPASYPPHPSYDEWLRRQIESGVIGEPMLRYVPKHLHSEFEKILLP